MTGERLVARRLIGRGEELARLARATAAAEHGVGRCVLIEGESGIGKTRLVGEVRAGFAGKTFEGRCYEEDASIPFAPLQAGLRALLRNIDGAETEAVSRRTDRLAHLLPELTGAPDVGDAPGGPAATQRALFEAIAGVFFDLAARNPLLVVLEDLHWSDESTLDFIRFLARRLEGRAVLLLATYRPDGIPATLASLLETLTRERLAEQIVLAPLERAEVDALLRALLESAQPVSPDFLDAVMAVSEGNPLFVEELVQSMVRAGDIYRTDGVWARKEVRELRVPASVQDAVRRQSETLLPATQRVLAVAATAGREFDFDLLSEVTQLPEADLVASLKELISAGLIREEQHDVFTFRHALLREAVQAQLLARERRRLHEQMATALERRYTAEGGEHSAELAYHTYEAGAWERALTYARVAGEQARQLDATREALTQFSRALDCASHLRGETPLDLLLARAELYERAGEFERASADLQVALEQAGRTGRQRETWQALLRLGFLWAARDYDRSLAFFEQALDAASALADPLPRAETLNRIGNVFLNRDQAERALPYHRAALEAFESAGDVAGQANTFELMAVCYYNLPDVLAGAECDERALVLARQADARSVAFHASIHLLLPLRFETEIGPPVQAERLAGLGEEALRFARASSWPAGEAQALGLLGGYYVLLGAYGRGLPYVHDSLRVAEAMGHAAGISASERLIAALLMELLAFDEAVARLRRAWSSATASGAHFFADIAALALCQALAARHGKGDLAEADAQVAGLLAGERLSVGRNRREALAVRAEIELALGKPEAALATLDSLVASTCHLPEHGLAGIPRLALLLGSALAAAGREEEAGDVLEAAVAGARAEHRKPLEWRAHALLGRLRLSQRQRRAAQDHFQEARRLVTELAATIPEAVLREDFKRKALGLIPLPPPSTERKVAMQARGGLTEREQSVASLVALGKSNREIAEALVISERTAERHVANILDKLGLASRVQLAAWATEHLPTL